ncbi:MAG TPA: phosphoribosylamine--glycine ligase [Candidatus Saccharimonadales bacterium]|nr:phosphoribosylamine--glycine ligase [Candidatus Saccharimonadales bacterium]
MAGSVLIIGSGGREHALAVEMSKSPDVTLIYCAPGNPGTASVQKTENLPFGPNDTAEIIKFTTAAKDGLTVVIGPEAPLVAGLADQLRQENIPVFGPNATAARLEGSKSFASDFMRKYTIPQPESQTVHTIDEAYDAIKNRAPETMVLKADGLAGGKGVVLPTTIIEAESTLASMLSGESFESAGADGVVIQERLSGPEVSVFVISDGDQYSIIPFFAQDHKRLGTGDTGPNTGGMGAYTPVPEKMFNEQGLSKIREIAAQTIAGMAKEGTPYQGVLYMGLMLAAERNGDPIVIEYNARFGDPETQVILCSLTGIDVDVYKMIRDTAAGNTPDLDDPKFTGQAALTICLAAKGYPENPEKGAVIHGLDKTYPNVIVHHGGTKQDGVEVVVSGGRVLYVTGQGASVDEAAQAAYAAVGEDGIHFEGMQYRTDIGHQARKL